ncbi:MFS transporter [Kangiella sp. HZ709]|uniref:MFS transporter n=1 Tax=Kangiella sp. HZ709 TaxID=2666328 RepID=UPI0012AFEDE8|nr:MFS transporter [Kangiella sp. HZ709]MRX28251.1 MFS transporter [Kangiella sp. HZ709]
MANQFQLFKQKFFSSYFVTQALGAFNDSTFKQALITLITYYSAGKIALEPQIMTNVAAGLFIVPFFLFSATAGQFAEKFEKSWLIRKIKVLEIFIMILAVIGLYLDNIYFLLTILFLLGLQSTFFGPIKYSILPQHLKDEELVGGNGMVEMGTFVAILIGTIVGGALIGYNETGKIVLSVLILSVAVLGYFASSRIPHTKAVQPDLKINWNPVTQTYKTLQFTRRNRVVFLAILGISWFWFYGTIFLTQINTFAKVSLDGNAFTAILLLTVFSVGIGLGSALCEKMSGKRVELGLVPFGAIGMTWFAIDLYLANPQVGFDGSLGPWQFIETPGAIRTLIDCTFVGVFGGFYIVPLYALVQERCDREFLSRVIAGNNIINSLFMVVAAVFAAGLLTLGITIPELLLITGILNAVVAIYIFTLVPEFLMRFLIWILISTIYKVKAKGLDKIPEDGPCVIVCNHVSYVDSLIIGGYVRRPIRFVMYYKIFQIPVLSFIFKTAKAIPIAGRSENESLLNKSMYQIQEALDAGEIVCIFPEGKLTSDGEMNEFKAGIEKIIANSPVPVVPMALQGLWHSLFSRKKTNKIADRIKRIRTRVGLVASDPIPASEVTKELLHDKVSELRDGQL